MSLTRSRSARPVATLAAFAFAFALLAVVLGACSDNSTTAPSARAAASTSAVAAPASTPAASATAAPATATLRASTTATLTPTSGRWIDVDVTRFVVRLMDGKTVVEEIAPVAVGAQVDTGAYESTQTGLFHVYNKIDGLTYDAPYKTYIDGWVGFDQEKANGFHSFLLDDKGKVIDASTGRISNGCIRTGEYQAVFAFAEVGMPVLVHA